MSSIAYSLGKKAGKKGLWFHETLENYLSQGLFPLGDQLEFYRGYWGDLFDVEYDGQRIKLVNRR